MNHTKYFYFFTIFLMTFSISQQSLAKERVFKYNPDTMKATDDNGVNCKYRADLANYHYSPMPSNMVVKAVGGQCKQGVIRRSDVVEYHHKGKLHAVAIYGRSFLDKVKKPFNKWANDYCSEHSWCVIFDDGEVWKHWGGWGTWEMQKLRDSNKTIKARNKRNKLAQKKRNAKVKAFRKRVKVGDDTSDGIVIKIKGNLIKIQSNNSQCSQRDYKNNCVNWINTPVEKWVKRSKIYPAN